MDPVWHWPPNGAAPATRIAYELPELMPGAARDAVSTAAWRARRGALLDGLAETTYGFTPSGGGLAGLHLVHEQPHLNGIRTDWLMTVAGPRGAMDIPVRSYRPAAPPAGGAPVFLGMNIVGNDQVEQMSGLPYGQWMPTAWPIRQILERGYGLVTLRHDEVEPDLDGAAWWGVRGLFDDIDGIRNRGPAAWGALGAWAWALSRTREAIAAMPGLDADRVIVNGHSRLGMTALWAAAQDEGFAAAISSESGLAGASLTRHVQGEDIAFASSHFPYWYCPNYAGYAHRDTEFPVDQHQLLALIAPRPLHVSSASEDRHADPEGEFLSTLHASPVYELFGRRGTLPAGARAAFDLSPDEAAAVPPPPLRQSVGDTLSFHIREGGHGMTRFDWSVFLDFADRTVANATPGHSG
ncbi:MAG: hypothetical protein FWD85_10830 [Microbacteriaceae bacterium]|nr:hypothetical protein [Microbacteriaceae bacterium]